MRCWSYYCTEWGTCRREQLLPLDQLTRSSADGVSTVTCVSPSLSYSVVSSALVISSLVFRFNSSPIFYSFLTVVRSRSKPFLAAEMLVSLALGIKRGVDDIARKKPVALKAPVCR